MLLSALRQWCLNVTDITEMAVDLEDIKLRLSKKATFEIAVADLHKLLRDSPGLISQDAAFDLIKRIMLLLRTRFTSPAFWRAGRGLCETAKVNTCLALGGPSAWQNMCVAFRYSQCVLRLLAGLIVARAGPGPLYCISCVWACRRRTQMQLGWPSMTSISRPVLNTWETCRAVAQLTGLLSSTRSTNLTSLKARCHRCSPPPSAIALKCNIPNKE